MRKIALLPVILTALWLVRSAGAVPATVIEQSHTIVGPAAGGRFGSAIACSVAAAATGNRSLIAVGAPTAFSNEGRVYIYDSSNPPVLLQTIAASSPVSGELFGSAAAFISDINGDGKEELVVGAPRPDAAQGTVYAFLSRASGDPFESTPCDSHQEAQQGYGGTLRRVSALAMGNPLVAVGAPEAGEVSSITIGHTGGNVCNISYSANFAVSGPAGRLGQSIAAVDGQFVLSDLLIGMPGSGGDQGEARRKVSSGAMSTVNTGAVGDRLGSAVAGSENTPYRAVSIPGANRVDLYAGFNNVFQCSKTVPMSDAPLTAGAKLADLWGAFLGLTPDNTVVPETIIASYRTELETGGSVGVFRAKNGDCSPAVYQVNNCLFGAQEQGYTIVSETGCNGVFGAGEARMLLTGSPAWQGDTGMLTVYHEGAPIHQPAKVCNTPTPTPTQTPDQTATPTPEPTATSGGAEQIVEVGPGADLGDDFLITFSNPSKRTTATILTPIFQFSDRFVKTFAKGRGLARKAALRLLMKQARFVVRGSYTTTQSAAIISAQQLSAATTGRRVTSIKEIRRKLNNRRITVNLRNLPTGARVGLTARIVFPPMKPGGKPRATKTKKLVFTVP